MNSARSKGTQSGRCTTACSYICVVRRASPHDVSAVARAAHTVSSVGLRCCKAVNRATMEHQLLAHCHGVLSATTAKHHALALLSHIDTIMTQRSSAMPHGNRLCGAAKHFQLCHDVWRSRQRQGAALPSPPPPPHTPNLRIPLPAAHCTACARRRPGRLC